MWYLKHKRAGKFYLKFTFLWCFFASFSQGLSKENGFRGGAKSYAIKVEANTLGTNLQYELPESKVKAATPNDWLVDNDNAEMTLALNSPILAKVILKHPKFSMKGQWPGYKVSFKTPKDVTSTKKHDFSRTRHTVRKLLVKKNVYSVNFQGKHHARNLFYNRNEKTLKNDWNKNQIQ